MYLVGLHIYYKMIHGRYNIKLYFISFTDSILLGFLLHPCRYARIIQEQAERNRIVTAHKFSFLNSAKVFFFSFLTCGMFTVLVKRIFSVNLQVVIWFCVTTCVKGKLSFGNFTEPGHFLGISMLLFSTSRASTCVYM